VNPQHKPATAVTARRNREAAASLPPEREDDLSDASRGLVAAFEPAVVTDASGRVVWDMASYDFLAGECPDTAHPSLWRQSRLNRLARSRPASTSCAASTSPTCTWSRASGASSSSTP
jgi:alkyl sulfatase BDS1-like metallo-beta-lactamase superfamily hydrolase